MINTRPSELGGQEGNLPPPIFAGIETKPSPSKCLELLLAPPPSRFSDLTTPCLFKVQLFTSEPSLKTSNLIFHPWTMGNYWTIAETVHIPSNQMCLSIEFVACCHWQPEPRMSLDIDEKFNFDCFSLGRDLIFLNNLTPTRSIFVKL